MLRFGVIGVGNMGEAILRGALSGKVLDAAHTMAYDPDTKKLQALQAALFIQAADSLDALCAVSDILLLAVKPNVCDALLAQSAKLFSKKAVISIVAGRSRERLSGALPDTRLLRVMPNTPALVGEGMIVFETGDTLTEEERMFAKLLFGAVGQTESAAPYLMDAVTGVSGSGPAYVYIFMEALADAGVRAGLTRQAATKLAAQTVLGAAKMVLQTGENPAELKNRVCSPGGTTIEAVAALEANGFRNAVFEAVDACIQKSKRMGK